jgi:TonB family protein
MKRTVVIFGTGVIFLLAIFAAARAGLRGQERQTVYKIENKIEWNKQAINVALVDGQVRLVFDRAVAKSRWQVGVHVADVKEAEITVALLTVKAAAGQPISRQIDKITNWPEAGINKSAGTIEFAGAPLSEDVAVHIIVPAGAKVSVLAGEESLFAAAVSEDLLINPKGISQKSMKNLAAIMLAAMISPTDREVITYGNNEKLVNLRMLKSHLQSSTRPEYPQQLRTGKNEHVLVKITIDASGNISQKSLSQGSPSLGNLCLTALNSWRFKPFIVDGAPSQVSGMIVFAFDRNGAVLVPVLGDGDSF